MKSKCLDSYEVFAALVNDGYIIAKQPLILGRSSYSVMVPGASRVNYVGHISEALIINLWKYGFLVGRGKEEQRGDFRILCFCLRKPDVSKLFDYALSNAEITPNEKVG